MKNVTPPVSLLRVGVWLLSFVALAINATAQTPWRSSLYSASWTPPTSLLFESDKLIQDFSFAGYRRGDVPVPTISGPIYDVTSYGADTTGAIDSTIAIQNAINAAAAGGGGVVYLPAGTFRISPQGTNAYALRLAANGVVLRGAGPGQTFLFNDSYAMRSKHIIRVEGSSSSWATVPSGSPQPTITADLLSPTTLIPVSSVAGFVVGDWVILRADATDAFIAEHNMTDLWAGQGSSLGGVQFLRQVTAIDTATQRLTIDVPIRYYLKTRDNARVHKAVAHVEEVGLENFSIGNREHANAGSATGWAEEDYNTVGNGSYDVHASFVVALRRARNCWISNVKTYRPAVNTLNTHILSNGILLEHSRGVTVRGCEFQRPLYGGGGGNGYMYRLQRANECLLRDCAARYNRHGFVFSHMATSGNVIHGGIAQVTRTQIAAPGTTSGEGCDHHMHLSHSNLIDGVQLDQDFFTAHYRGTSGTPPQHGQTSAHTVYWNLVGLAYHSTKTFIVRSEQARYGYMIGTRGAASGMTTTGADATRTAPVDHAEGAGLGGALEPLSLYYDQVSRRLGIAPVPPTPTALSAAGGDGQVALTWNASSGATSYNVRRATASGGPYSTIANVVTNVHTDTGRTNGVTYYYVVSAMNSAGESGDSYEAAATPNAAFQQDAGVDGIVAIEVEHYDANVAQGGQAWTVNTTAGYSGDSALQATPNNGTTRDTGFTTTSPRLDFRINFNRTGTHYIWVRGIGPAGGDDSIHAGLNGAAIATSDRITSFATGWTWKNTTMDGPVATIDIPSAGVHTINLWMREDGVIIDKFMLTVNAGFTPSGTGPAESPRGGGALPPAAPTGLAATTVSTSQINLVWSASAGAQSYNVKRATTSGGPYATVATGIPATSYNDTGLSGATTYYYVVAAVNAAGESANSAEASATTQTPQAPPAPATLSATAGDAQVALSWAASAEATSYNAKRATVSGGPYATIGVTSSTSLLDTAVTNGTTYHYVVSALNAYGESGDSPQASATPQAASTVLPPTSLAANGGKGKIALSWIQSASANIRSNKVYRATASGGPYALVATFNAKTTYNDSVAAGTTYYYVVTAVTTAGAESPYSNQASGIAR